MGGGTLGGGDVSSGSTGSGGTLGNDASAPDSADVGSAADAVPELGPDPSLGVGNPCTNDNACMPGLLCLDEGEQWPAEGYCTMECTIDEECGGDAFCSAPLGLDGGRICIKSCESDTHCAVARRSCSRTLAAALDLGQPGCVPGNAAAKDGSPCTTFGDCSGRQTCASNPFSAPDGICVTVGCTPGDNTTCAPGGDGFCVAFNNSGLCLDTCTAPAECRVAQGYTCQDADPTDAFPGICAYNAKKVGAACATTDCGPDPWECLTGSRFPGGYCGARACTVGTAATCPFDSHCYDPDAARVNDQFCVAECRKDEDCRMAEGYTCKPLGATPADGKGCLAN